MSKYARSAPKIERLSTSPRGRYRHRDRHRDRDRYYWSEKTDCDPDTDSDTDDQVAQPFSCAYGCAKGPRITAGRYRTQWAAVFCLLAVISMPAASADKITLGLHLKTGQILNLTTTTESNLTQTIMGQEMNAVSTTRMGYKYEVQQVADDGTATLKVTYSTVQVNMSMGGFTLEYDSTNPTASVSPMIKPFAVLVGQSFSLRISPTGRVTDVQGAEAIFEKMLKGAEVPDESMRGTMEQQIKEQFGADGIRESMEQSIGPHFPEGAVDIGDTWIKRAAVARPYPMILESTYTLKDRKDGVAVMDMVSKISTNPAGKPLQIGPMTMTYDFSGERKGQLEIEEASGWTVSARYIQQISGSIKAEGGPQGTMSFPVSGTITVRIVR